MLQVPYVQDFEEVANYIAGKTGKPYRAFKTVDTVIFGSLGVIVVCAGDEWWEPLGFNCPIFLIERDHDPIIPGVYGYDPAMVEE